MDYEKLISLITKGSGLKKEDIERRIEAKRAKLSGLVSKEGAAQIVASELGVRFDRQKVKINELMQGMKKVGVIGKIIALYPVREFMRKESKSKVCSFVLADDTASVRVVLWDTNHIRLVEEKIIAQGSVIEIKNAAVRGDELHLSGLSEISKSDEEIAAIEKPAEKEKTINELSENDRAFFRAAIVQAFEPRFFNVCPECGKRAEQEGNQFSCSQHGVVAPKERFLIGLMLDDGKANIRAVLFTEQAEKLFGETNMKSPDVFLKKKEEILGKEFYFSGRARINKLFNTLEFTIDNVNDIDIDELIAKLQKNKG